jgi:hypothetical protein
MLKAAILNVTRGIRIMPDFRLSEPRCCRFKSSGVFYIDREMSPTFRRRVANLSPWCSCSAWPWWWKEIQSFRTSVTDHQTTQRNIIENRVIKISIISNKNSAYTYYITLYYYTRIIWKENSCFEGLYETNYPLKSSLCIRHLPWKI